MPANHARFTKGQCKAQGSKLVKRTPERQIAWLEERARAYEAQGDNEGVAICKARIARLS